MRAKGSIDRIDLRILSELQSHGRLSNKDMAEQVHLSPSACLERVNRLEKQGIIRHYQGIVDPKQLCRSVSVFATAKLHDHRQKHFIAFAEVVNTMPEVVECHMVSGHFDFILRVVCSDMDRYVELCNQLLDTGPRNIELTSHVVLEVTKPFAGLALEELVSL